MNTPTPARLTPRRALLIFTFVTALLLTVSPGAHGANTQAPAPQKRAQTTAAATARKPSEVLREFYRAMREKRFREAFAMTIYSPAVEPLSASEYEELRPDFEAFAAEIPERIEFAGEQVSGDAATVFEKVSEGGVDKLKPTELIRSGETWIVGGRGDQLIVRERGKKFFFEARIEAHHSLVEETLKRIAAAQILHSAQNGGRFADLPGLVRGGHVPAGVLTPDSTGYRFHITVTKDGKGYNGGAEPVAYNRTGRLSFYLDQNGFKSKDNGGKPLKK